MCLVEIYFLKLSKYANGSFHYPFHSRSSLWKLGSPLYSASLKKVAVSGGAQKGWHRKPTLFIRLRLHKTLCAVFRRAKRYFWRIKGQWQLHKDSLLSSKLKKPDRKYNVSLGIKLYNNNEWLHMKTVILNIINMRISYNTVTLGALTWDTISSKPVVLSQ